MRWGKRQKPNGWICHQLWKSISFMWSGLPYFVLGNIIYWFNRESMRRAKITVVDCQDRRQKVVWGNASLWRTVIAVWRNLFYWSSIQIKWIPLAVSPAFPSLFKMENKLVLLLSCWSVLPLCYQSQIIQLRFPIQLKAEKVVLRNRKQNNREWSSRGR